MSVQQVLAVASLVIGAPTLRAATVSGGAIEAVFLGDSITEGGLSKAPALFMPGRLCRGIGGQTTPQLLLRFRPRT